MLDCFPVPQRVRAGFTHHSACFTHHSVCHGRCSTAFLHLVPTSLPHRTDAAALLPPSPNSQSGVPAPSPCLPPSPPRSARSVCRHRGGAAQLCGRAGGHEGCWRMRFVFDCPVRLCRGGGTAQLGGRAGGAVVGELREAHECCWLARLGSVTAHCACCCLHACRRRQSCAALPPPLIQPQSCCCPLVCLQVEDGHVLAVVAPPQAAAATA